MPDLRPHIATLRSLVNQPERWDFSGARELFCGVDIGTATVVAVVVDETGRPRGARLQPAEVVKSGLVVDYVGALEIVRGLVGELREASALPIEKGATSFPPDTETGNINTTRYILEGAGLEVLKVLDEPSAANVALGIVNGAICDVGGGTTGVAVIQDGRVVYSGDEATGGVHLSLVLAGGYRISLEEAEALKADKSKNAEILPVVRPVLDKIASIVARHLAGHAIDEVWMVGGTCELEGLCQVVGANLNLPTQRTEYSQIVTPLGIALSCLNGQGGQ
ncbi:MAG: ethanolamine utilization protein EutJ [Deltaproteobacteria bacterium]|nr:ethanolamine utilization protein EutJ [Deltaproteobacteria bacterium]